MDPTVCLQLILDAIADQDREEAYDGLEDLLTWLASGGAFPDLDKLGWSNKIDAP